MTVPEFASIISNFIQETTFNKDVSLINYPAVGNYGKNILDSAVTEIQSNTDYSLAASLSEGCLSLRIRISKENGDYSRNFSYTGGQSVDLGFSLSGFESGTYLNRIF
ncbi:MAG: hypothetical protein OXH57_09605 [Ekhidna sp.]|nr:hypothetical protein [Ekhidna sp.]